MEIAEITAVGRRDLPKRGAPSLETPPGKVLHGNWSDHVPPSRALLWREAGGHEIRLERLRQHRTQSDVAAAAGISTQYLSEIERGRKDPSSEILEAVLGSLGLQLVDLTQRVTAMLISEDLVGVDLRSQTDSASNLSAFPGPHGAMLLAA